MKEKLRTEIKKIFSKKFILLYAFFITISVGIIINAYSTNRSHSIDECLACHEDKDLTMEKNGKKISLFVDAASFKKSTHSGNECTDCHLNYKAEDIPHNPNKKDVNCNECHGVKHADGSVHTNLKCYTCHSFHTVKPAKELTAEKSQFCVTCHNTASVTSFKTSIHFKKNINCDNCHKGGHNVIKFTKASGSQMCATCHKKENLDLKSSVHGKSISGVKSPVCLDCHVAHGVTGNKFTQETKACLNCHLDAKKFPGEERGSAIFTGQYEKSIHATSMKNGKPVATCTDCHGNHMIKKMTDPDVKNQLLKTCGKCHGDIVEKYNKSSHGKAFANNNKDAPTCITCHGEHGINAVKLESKFSKLNLTELCLNCHKEGGVAYIENSNVKDYKLSPHYIALTSGKDNAATCADCHGAHEMLPASDINSKVNKKNVANTCGSDACHKKQNEDYTGSIHQISIATKPKSDAPTCSNCHGGHQIASPNIVGSKLYGGKGVVQLCSDCHSSVEIVQNNNLPKGVAENFSESFHGLAIRGGSKQAADCGSCHGYHNIRPSSDAKSTINKNNLPQTCGKCHPGANKSVFDTPIHITDAAKQSPLLNFITIFYIILICGTIGFMVLHNILDFRKKIKKTH